MRALSHDKTNLGVNCAATSANILHCLRSEVSRQNIEWATTSAKIANGLTKSANIMCATRPFAKINFLLATDKLN
jgi:hypothetical protein